jgi:RsiW-degrading membrane proteinase PrsW (M82 family)
MPARTNSAPDDRMKDWLSSQIDTFQDFLNRLASPVFAVADQVLVVLSYLNPFTYIFLIFNFFYRLCVSPHTHRSILGSIILGFIFIISLLLSIIAYITFYRAYVPHVGFRLPVWLNYGYVSIP